MQTQLVMMKRIGILMLGNLIWSVIRIIYWGKVVVKILEDLRLLNTKNSRKFKVIKLLVKKLFIILDKVYKNQVKIFKWLWCLRNLKFLHLLEIQLLMHKVLQLNEKIHLNNVKITKKLLLLCMAHSVDQSNKKNKKNQPRDLLNK